MSNSNDGVVIDAAFDVTHQGIASCKDPITAVGLAADPFLPG